MRRNQSTNGLCFMHRLDNDGSFYSRYCHLLFTLYDVRRIKRYHVQYCVVLYEAIPQNSIAFQKKIIDGVIVDLYTYIIYYDNL